MEATILVDRSIPGIRVVTEQPPWCHSAAVGIWIGAGSAAEGPDEHGAAHFLEHVLFKRTSTASGRELSERIDLLGGAHRAEPGRWARSPVVAGRDEDCEQVMLSLTRMTHRGAAGLIARPGG